MDKVLIDNFEGPLDLLLHLVKQSKMDISEIKIVDITSQYLNYLRDMKNLNLDIASEYLVTASELIEMKSRFLLPVQKQDETSEYEENPEEELKRRLLEYKKYKESIEDFRGLEEKRSAYYTKAPERINSYTQIKLEKNDEVDAYDLLHALEELLKRREYSKPLNTRITKKEISVKDRINKIRNILKKEKVVEFTSLFEVLTKSYVVVTFLSVLEMAKNNEITLKQDNNFGTIVLERVD